MKSQDTTRSGARAADVEQTAADVLRARAARLAVPLPPAPYEAALELAALGFQLGHEHYAIETFYVWKVLHGAEITPLPVTDPCVLGLCSLQGELLPVFDLARLLATSDASVTLAEPAGRVDGRLIMLGRDRPELAVAVDAFEELAPFDSAALLEPSLTHERAAFVRAMTADARILLDGAALLSHPRLYIDETAQSAETDLRGQT